MRHSPVSKYYGRHMRDYYLWLWDSPGLLAEPVGHYDNELAALPRPRPRSGCYQLQ